MKTNPIVTMADPELLERILKVANDERHTTAELLALLGEVDSRRLFHGEGCSSLFTYCTQVLRLSEHAAYHRIEGARAARRFPLILDLVADGSVTLTTVAMLHPHLTPESHEAVLTAARHKTKREVEHQIACLAPKPDAPVLIRRLPTCSQTESKAAKMSCGVDVVRTVDAPRITPASVQASHPAEPRSRTAPLAADRYLLRVTLSADAHAKLRRSQELLGHSVPSGDPAIIIDKALSLLVTELERVKIANVRRPRPGGVARTSPSASGSRHIPADVRRQVWARDDGRCAFVGTRGRCTETGRLEFHHVVPFARGGATSVDNLALRCRAHNSFESDSLFGPRSRALKVTELGPDRVPRILSTEAIHAEATTPLR